jgi:uncharacterized membrane protein YjjP (DUF1212 family)
MSDRHLQTKLLLQAGRLLLEYNESTGAIHHTLTATARALTEETCHVTVSYGGVAVSLAEDGLTVEPVPELRYNMAVQARVHRILEQVRRGVLDAATALASLEKVEADTPRHSRWLAVLTLGAAAASLALLLGADGSAAAVAGLATGLGLLARQELARRHVSLPALPLTAAFIGGALGRLAIRLNWTESPELVLIVPSLMVVPGPHLINGLLDAIDNYLPMSLSRLGLAMIILLASSLGIILGVEIIEITLPGPFPFAHSAPPERLTFVSDAALAGIVATGFAVFYNTAWRQLWMAMVGGMAGHGMCFFLTHELGWPIEAATFMGGLTVGALSAGMARFSKTPVAVIGFAGAVTMIPGLSLYHALGGALQLARSTDTLNPKMVTDTLGNALKGGLVVAMLALGLILGTRGVLLPTRKRNARIGSNAGYKSRVATGRFTVEAADETEATCRLSESVLQDPGTADVVGTGEND